MTQMRKLYFCQAGRHRLMKILTIRHCHTSNQIGATAGFYFDGERFDFLYSSAPSYGQIDIYIDGLFSATINQFSLLNQITRISGTVLSWTIQITS